jgi:methylmalonyl-CoA mutase C-terminal domain/subunit
MAIRCLLGKIGTDGHDRGVRTISQALRDAGIEVIYLGPWQKIDAVVKTAIQEDVDVIGISTLSGDYLLIPKLMKALRENRVDVPVILGGIVPKDAEEMVRRHGVVEVFHPGTDMETIVNRIESLARNRKGGQNG